MLVRPVPFCLAAGLALLDLASFDFLPRSEAFGVACFGSIFISGAILFWMMVLVRGDNGLMGRLIGIERDASLGFPLRAAFLLVAGIGLVSVALRRQQAHPDAISLFACGLAIMAAGSTQLRRTEG